MLRAGQNVVEIVARHTHRVACGPDASFALWTEVAAVQSGVALSSADFGTDAIGFVSALAAQVAQGASIPLRRADPQQPLGNAGPLLAELSALIGGPPPGIVTRPHWTVADDGAPMARLTVVPREAGLMAPRVARKRRRSACPVGRGRHRLVRSAPDPRHRVRGPGRRRDTRPGARQADHAWRAGAGPPDGRRALRCTDRAVQPAARLADADIGQGPARSGLHLRCRIAGGRASCWSRPTARPSRCCRSMRRWSNRCRP